MKYRMLRIYFSKLFENAKVYILQEPCVIESQGLLNIVAEELVRLNKKYGIDIILSSFDKANRTS